MDDIYSERLTFHSPPSKFGDSRELALRRSTAYLHRLQPKSKWWRTKPNLRRGDMVIVKKEQNAQLNWTLGRINELFFGPDQKVRVVSVSTKYVDK
ncbi:hypothetical protein TNCV_460541 [Trichonephila clavipes]|nr:hypothetical protein TNCV_460541 [Trichonephila clavipes]